MQTASSWHKGGEPALDWIHHNHLVDVIGSSLPVLGPWAGAPLGVLHGGRNHRNGRLPAQGAPAGYSVSRQNSPRKLK